MFTIEMLPAQRGDSIWITYGTPDDQHHVLIDAGPSNTLDTLVPELERRVKAIPGRKNRIELLVVTHIDADHIQGIVSLLSDPKRVPLFRDVWFNGFKHHSEVLGALDAEQLSAVLEQHPDHWNAAFGGHAVRVPDDGPLPVVELAGGMRLTLLAPDREAMVKLIPEWEETCRKAGIAPGGGAPIVKKSVLRDQLLGGFEPDLLASSKFSSDPSAPNGAGIAFIAEFGGKRALLLADSPVKLLLRSLDRLEPRPHRFDAVKVSHHGSRRNTSLEFAQAVQAKKWLVSTDGAVFGHPDPECLARIIVSQKRVPEFSFNYATEHITDIVDGAGERYKVKLPRRSGEGFREGITVSV
ncbi:hypothetical protein SAMN04487846_2903 [Microbacterium sp. cf046]|uniref:ComEC/Rec2 family competence protein n=1 Tax=Microbacterium sp. cf046 TaxID=1761803 RepID=UPI0008F00CD8|nr:hypothetical protein [Microbacterium sp. cf046]SFS14349.1 hypothetical protein SAMN04487846_2903 [Microbacterium sp. cf046]